MKDLHSLTSSMLDKLTDQLAAERDRLDRRDPKADGLDRAIELIEQAQHAAATARLNRMAKRAHA